jgi:hypothetical protein
VNQFSIAVAIELQEPQIHLEWTTRIAQSVVNNAIVIVVDRQIPSLAATIPFAPRIRLIKVE